MCKKIDFSTMSGRLCIIRTELFDNSNKKMAATLNIDQTTLSRYCSTQINLGYKIIEVIGNRLPQINMNWLIFGRGEMLLKSNDNDALEAMQMQIDRMQEQLDRESKILSSIASVFKGLGDIYEAL